MRIILTRLLLVAAGLLVALSVAVSGLLHADPVPAATPPAESSPSPAVASPAASPSPAAEKAEPTYVGSETCLSCHDKMQKSFDKTPHRKIMQTSKDHEAWKGCESCHGPGSEHVNAGGGRGVGIKMWKEPMRLTGKDAREASDICLKCHKDDNRLATWHASTHSASTVACIACHDPHRSDHPRLLRLPWQPDPIAARETVPSAPKDFEMEPTQLCLQCHKSYKAQAMMPSHHPLLEGKMACTSCHDVHSLSNNNIRAISVNELCAKCHREKTGPNAFEHAPATDSCATCHRVHGAVNDNLLSVPLPTLCIKCHRAPHMGWSVNASVNNRLGRNLSYSRCSTCHTQIHGSDQSIYFLY